MFETIRGVVKDGVIVPSSHLPEGAEVEIRVCAVHVVAVEMNTAVQSEFDSWQQANASLLGTVTQELDPDATAEESPLPEKKPEASKSSRKKK